MAQSDNRVQQSYLLQTVCKGFSKPSLDSFYALVAVVFRVTTVLEDSLPVLAILIVVFSMIGVDVLIIGNALRALTVIPILLVLLLWVFATYRIRRET